MSKNAWCLTDVFCVLHSYANALLSFKLEASSQGQDNLSWNEIQNCIDMINAQIQEENDRKYGALSFF